MMSEIERLESVVSDHAISIALMTKAVSSIEALLTQQTNSIKEIEKAMKSQELLMEKLSHLDSRLSDSINRIHKRIDANESAVQLLKQEHENDLTEMAKLYQAKCDIVTPMAQKGAFVHGLLVKASIGLAVSVAAVLGTIMVWAIEQGGTK